LVLSWAVAYVLAKAFVLTLSATASIGGEPKELFRVRGDAAWAVLAGLVVFTALVSVTFGMAWLSTPALKIVGVRPLTTAADRQMIVVRNRSSQPMRFFANLEWISCDIAHHLPTRLQLAGSQPPYDEMDIQGGKPESVNVFRFSLTGPQLLFPNIGEIQAWPMPIPRGDHTLRISVKGHSGQRRLL
jgi:hypothetical protein